MEEINAEHKPPTIPPPQVAMICPKDIVPLFVADSPSIAAESKFTVFVPAMSSSRPTNIIFPKMLVTQQINIAEKAVQSPDIKFTESAAVSGALENIFPTITNRRPINKNKGAPGG